MNSPTQAPSLDAPTPHADVVVLLIQIDLTDEESTPLYVFDSDGRKILL